MTKEKVKQLNKYLSDLKSRLSSTTIPEKHKHRVESYKRYLNNEIATVTSQLEREKLEGQAK